MRGSRGYKDLIVYQKAFALAMKVFHLTKKFPKEERYLLIDQFRRSSRSVCSCLAEAYRKRKYQPYFVNKITDADAENSETEVWIDFAYACEYISEDEKEDLENDAEEVGRMLKSMSENPEKFLPKDKKLIVA